MRSSSSLGLLILTLLYSSNAIPHEEVAINFFKLRTGRFWTPSLFPEIPCVANEIQTATLAAGKIWKFTSLNYPFEKYPSDSNCTWIFRIPQSANIGEISITCDHFHVDGNLFTDCSNGDYLQLKDDNNPDEEYQERLCGDLSKWTPIVAVLPDPYDDGQSKNYVRHVTARFSTNSVDEGTGFSCRILGHKRKAHITTPSTVATTTTTTLAPIKCPSLDEAFCECGRVKNISNLDFSRMNNPIDSSFDFKIIGGRETDPNQYPWQVGLEYDEFLYCGGSLISKKHVLTAAHCTDYFSSGYLELSSLTVLLGEHDLSTNRDCAYRVAVKRLFQHSAYNSSNFEYDFSVLELEREIQCSDHIGPVCLPKDSSDDYADEEVVVTGWGVTEEGASATILKHVVVDTMSNNKCQVKYGSSYSITDSMLCAARAGKDSCQGDSGGPLMHLNQLHDEFTIVGVTSWGLGCADEDYPGVYSRVTSVLSWIKKILKSSRNV